MISATDKQMDDMTQWLVSHGYDFDMRDGLWMEEYVRDHKWRDIFDMLASWEARQASGIDGTAIKLLRRVAEYSYSVELTDFDLQLRAILRDIQKWYNGTHC